MCYTPLYQYYTIVHTHPFPLESPLLKHLQIYPCLHEYIKYNKAIYKWKVCAKAKQKKHKNGAKPTPKQNT